MTSHAGHLFDESPEEIRLDFALGGWRAITIMASLTAVLAIKLGWWIIAILFALSACVGVSMWIHAERLMDIARSKTLAERRECLDCSAAKRRGY